MLTILKYPDIRLKKPCSAVSIVTDEEKDILQKMTKTMYLNKGIGLAASQIGINKQLAVIDIGDQKLIKLINPVIIESAGKEIMEEGCLSIPNVYVEVKRPTWIKVKSLDENGNEVAIKATGLAARAILHETDHLRGRLITNYLNPIKRFFILRRK